MAKIAVYPGSFDPITFGHINIVERGLEIFDNIIIAVAGNSSGKKPFFSSEERIDIIKKLFKKEKRVTTEPFNGLLINYVKAKKAEVILKGLRSVTDFEYELQMALANKNLSGNIETVFMMTEDKYSFISSTIIKEILSLGGSVKGLAPDVVVQEFNKKMKERKSDIVSWE
ncbi:MAG: pantetheine-phosphate adenylyltransferase [Deltaproteobacteria bacterium]|nr:pantetheine-phosphate adenylyltransferase [Deltaproteobacteria bacterium]MCL5792234.1 pantetheine-phosphate adenylyltransferase [Deltaproteobacteria bacterium]